MLTLNDKSTMTKKWIIIFVAIIAAFLLTGCIPSGAANKSTLAFVFSLAAAIGALYETLRDRCAARCEKKVRRLEGQMHDHECSRKGNE